ncbi:MAG: fumarylacetoacetate hydrolase family protein [Treponema sp.]|jgi:2-keto-4-pentenoate hydratase|nr:fumarylacetoacetate hydrolase family protein [Treponema sp.]
MDGSKIAAFADELFKAERERKAVSPLSQRDGALTVDDAYQIQLVNVKRVVGMGHVISGKKIGLTSPGIQKQLGVNEPDYGHLFAAMECKDGRINTAALLQPKIEGEIAFVLKADLAGGNVTREDVLNATDYVAAAFEIVDSRVADWKIKLVDTVADNASSGRYVLGSARLAAAGADLPEVTMKLYKNGSLAGEGAGKAVLGDPAVSVAWLANRLWGYGVTLKAGEVVLSGAFSAAPEAAKGDAFTAEFSSFGTVTAEFY